MKNLIIKVVIVCAIAFSSVFSLTTNSAYASAVSSFLKTCDNISVNKSGILSATCKQPDGKLQNTQINLDKSIENKDGKLDFVSTPQEEEAFSHVFADLNGDDWFYFEDQTVN